MAGFFSFLKRHLLSCGPCMGCTRVSILEGLQNFLNETKPHKPGKIWVTIALTECMSGHCQGYVVNCSMYYGLWGLE